MTALATASRAAGSIKCVVWDLDDTLWQGVLLEDASVRCTADMLAVLHELDRRGILLSIASRNEPAVVHEKLEELGIADMFLYGQIGWGAKSESIRAIARALNIGIDSIAFVDDQPFERAEVASALPSTLCLSPDDFPEVLADPALTPHVVTADARQRRAMYRAAARRDVAEREFVGPSEAFLASLDIACHIHAAGADDLARVQELTLRTHQLNSTGYTYSEDELAALAQSADHRVLVATLTDRFGSYGTIGLVLLARAPDAWVLKLLLVSCRVMSRGVGSLLLGHLVARCRADGLHLRAEFRPTDRNRIMEITYRLAGFRPAAPATRGEGSEGEEVQCLEYDGTTPVVPPATVRVTVEPW